MTQDCWIPRITLLSQLVLLVVCAVLIGLGHDSIITDLFCAGSGGILATGLLAKGLNKISAQGEEKPPSDQG